MSKQQTALQDFWDKIALKLSFEQIDEFLPLFYTAKEIEKEQHKKIRNDALSEIENKLELLKQTYGGNK